MNPTLDYLKGTAGAVIGAIVGGAAVIALLRANLYAGILTGAGAGWGAQLAFPGREKAMGVIAAVIALAASLVVEWLAFYSDNNTLVVFLQNIATISPINLLMIAVGVAVAFAWGQGK